MTPVRADVIAFLLEQEALPHNHTEDVTPCPTWCCVRRAHELRERLEAPLEAV